MIKIMPYSLDLNCLEPVGSFFFCRDLANFHPDFQVVHNISEADVIFFPQYSNYVHAPFSFAREIIDDLAHSNKPIIVQNDGGGCPETWESNEIWAALQCELADQLRIYFSVECYPQHKKYFKEHVAYEPFEFVGYVGAGLGLRETKPLQSKESFIARKNDTFVSMTVYGSRKIWFDFLNDNPPWVSHHHSPNPGPDISVVTVERIGWEETMGGQLGAKLSFALDGATAKTERHHTTPCFTAMAIAQDNVRWAYPWVDGENCIVLPYDIIGNAKEVPEEEWPFNSHDFRQINVEKSRDVVLDWLSRPDDLYEVYCAGHETDKKYQLPNYFRDHVGETIKRFL